MKSNFRDCQPGLPINQEQNKNLPFSILIYLNTCHFIQFHDHMFSTCFAKKKIGSDGKCVSQHHKQLYYVPRVWSGKKLHLAIIFQQLSRSYIYLVVWKCMFLQQVQQVFFWLDFSIFYKQCCMYHIHLTKWWHH